MLIRTYKYKLYNNISYVKKYDRWMDISRCVYNLAKESKYEAHRKGIYLSNYDLSKQLTDCKSEFGWMREVNAQSLQAVLERLEESYQNYFKRLKNGEISKGKTQYIAKKQKNGGKISQEKLRNFGKPKWAKKGRFKTIIFKQGNIHKKTKSIYQTDKGFKLPKFGEVKVFNNKRKVDGKIKQIHLTKEIDELYLYVIVEEQEKPRESQAGSICSIDMGIKYFYVNSDGEYQENPKHLFKRLKELRVAQRSMDKKYVDELKQQSKNWYKQKLVVSKLHKKVKNCRADFLHKKSTNLAKKYSIIIIEELDILDILNGKKYSQHILDCSWGKFFELLKYKTNVVKIDTAYTSQECSKCGHTCKKNRTTQSLFCCVSCGHTANADFDACQVLLNRYYEGGVSPVGANVGGCTERSQDSFQ